MIDFLNLKKITLPEGDVYTVRDSSNNLLWEKTKIYGVSWAGGTSAAMTRTDESASFTSPKIGTGSTKGSSPFDNRYPWSAIKTETIDGNVLVKIPKYWYKWTKSGSTMKLQIADKPADGFFVSPMHADRGDGAGERNFAYIGKYKCASDYKSKSGVAPITSVSISTCRTKIKSLGTGYYQQDYASYWTLRMLFLVEWATWDGQSILQNTTDFSSLANVKTGETSSMSYHTGVSANGHSVQYRYVEDPWENMLEWIDGIYYNSSKVYCIKNPNNFATGANGTSIGTRITSSGYIKSWTVPTASGFEYALIPASVNTDAGYTMDSYYYVSTGTVLYNGGARNAWGVHGPWFMYTDFTASQTSTVITSRLMYLPS